MQPTLPSLLLSAGAVLFLTACSGKDAGASSSARIDTSLPAVDKPLKAYQAKLLDLAFKAVTRMPVNPHIKDRSEAQEAVVDACLELDQPRRALGCIQGIENWRQGAGYADLAYYCVQHGHRGEVQRYLDLASQIADRSMRSENAQAWRRDRIRTKIAGTYALLGEDKKVAEFLSGAQTSEARGVEVVKVRAGDPDALDRQVKVMQDLLASGDFDQIKHGLKAGAELFGRLYQDKKQRARIEEGIRKINKKLPIEIRIGVLSDMAGFALDHRDQQKALELVKEARAILDAARWLPENQVPQMARLAALRYRAGDRDTAWRELDAALALFDAKRDVIQNFCRAGALRPVAEACHAMGDKATALKIYKRAVEDGAENPNSRPRAQDLSATCCSLALHGVEPDADLERRLIEVCDRLGDPW